MHEAATRWAAAALGADVTCVTELQGGLSSTMLALTDVAGNESVLRLITNEPWRASGPQLITREHQAQLSLTDSLIAAPRSLAIDARGELCGHPAHLMSRLPGTPLAQITEPALVAMAETLLAIHRFRPAARFRSYESWAGPEKWSVPLWADDPRPWEGAFAVLRQPAPFYERAFLHRDFSHRNVLWEGESVSGVVDWVETSIGPRWLDVGHAATNLAVSFGPSHARRFIELYAELGGVEPDRYWLVMDTVGFLPSVGAEPTFEQPDELDRYESWLRELVS